MIGATTAQRFGLMHSLITVLSLAISASGGDAPEGRIIPRTLPHHPGNVFLEGESVKLTLPQPGTWQIFDAEEKPLREVQVSGTTIDLGAFPVGYYRLKSPSYEDWLSFAVLTPLKAPTPETSPIALDVAMSWFYPEDKMPDVANLCALAGVNWVRDRLSWAEVEPERGHFRSRTRYDAAADAQTSAGLKVLQVYHSSPRWANPQTKRFPPDLRDCYRFLKTISARWEGKVLAYEPWNEADIQVFGGHTGAEMASLQKASFWAIRSGNPRAIVCWNVFATNNPAHLEDIAANDILPYCDTFNFHHYRPLEEYPALYESFRRISGGRPLWVSECAMPLRWTGDPERQELSEDDLFEQARRLVKVFVGSLHEGAAATFYFLLPHYVEGPTQFGIIRRDLTPRPAYVALAAVGRLMADAKPLGTLSDGNMRAYAFSARPDGEPKMVMVAWSREGRSLQLPTKPEAIYDYLGRPQQPPNTEIHLTNSPLFLIFSPEQSREFTFTPPPSHTESYQGQPCPVVFQTLWPADRVDLQKSAYRISEASDGVTFPIFIYNFSSAPCAGTLQLTIPQGWTAELPEACQISPEERLEFALRLSPPKSDWPPPAVIRIEGNFGELGKAVLSFRLTR